jgi:hypothetical protein
VKNVAYDSVRAKSISLPDRWRIDRGGSGGDDGDVEARIKALEDANLEMRDRLSRIETKLDTVATKADLQEVRVACTRLLQASIRRC